MKAFKCLRVSYFYVSSNYIYADSSFVSCVEQNIFSQASSAYWRGDKERESLQRVYGISYPDQKQLKVTDSL